MNDDIAVGVSLRKPYLQPFAGRRHLLIQLGGCLDDDYADDDEEEDGGVEALLLLLLLHLHSGCRGEPSECHAT